MRAAAQPCMSLWLACLHGLRCVVKSRPVSFISCGERAVDRVSVEKPQCLRLNLLADDCKVQQHNACRGYAKAWGM